MYILHRPTRNGDALAHPPFAGDFVYMPKEFLSRAVELGRDGGSSATQCMCAVMTLMSIYFFVF